MKSVDFFPIHGVTKEIDGQTYYTSLINGIREHLPVDFDLRIHPIDHSHLLKEKEETIFGWFRGDWYQSIRKFIANYVCDVLAFSPPEIPQAGNFYYDVLQLIEKKYDEVNKAYPQSKKVIFGHSLGAEIGFTFSFKREVDHFFSCGSPIDWFAVRFPNFGKFPEATLHEWTNFHYRQDLVSGRVTRNPNFKRKNVRDVVLDIWNPLNWIPRKAHSLFWNDSRMHKIIAESLKSLA